MNKENEIIKTDVKITRRISEDPEYMKRIIKAHQAVTTLEITNRRCKLFRSNIL